MSAGGRATLVVALLKKLLIVLAVVAAFVAVLAGAGWAARDWLGGGGGDAAEVVVRLEPAEVGELVERVTAPGRLEARENVQISARTSARIDELPFREGDAVEAGDVLVRLDATNLAARLRAAEARLAAQQVDIDVAQSRLTAARARLRADQASLVEAERDLERKQTLYETRDISQSDLETAQARYDRLRAELEAARTQLEADESNLRAMALRLDVGRAEIEQAQDEVSYAVITSPIAGVVTRLNAEVGELVITGTMNNAGTVIMDVADLNTMLVRAEVYESDITRIEVGQPAEVRIDAYPDQTFAGEVINVALARTQERTGITSGASATGSNTYKVEILLGDAGRRLLGDLTADVEIRTRVNQGVVLVPTQAVLGHAVDDLPPAVRELPVVDQTKAVVPVVYVVEAGVAKARPVKIGPSDMTHTIIEEGLETGAGVVTGPFSALENLKDGAKVTVE